VKPFFFVSFVCFVVPLVSLKEPRKKQKTRIRVVDPRPAPEAADELMILIIQPAARLA